MAKISGGVVHTVPPDLKKSLAADKIALSAWESLTPLSRNEWICWTTFVKQAETRKEHVRQVISELKKGIRRPCCWMGCIHRKDKKISPSVQWALSKKSKKVIVSSMAELKTKATTNSVLQFLKSVQPKDKQADALAVLKMFESATGEKAVMWGTSIVGFGKYHYKSEKSSQEGDWMLVGFSPRKQNLTLYILHGNKENELLDKLGKHKVSGGGMGGCLYINKLSDVNQKVLAQLIKKAYQLKKKTTS